MAWFFSVAWGNWMTAKANDQTWKAKGYPNLAMLKRLASEKKRPRAGYWVKLNLAGYIYMYICIDVYMYICIYVYIYISIYIYIYMYIYIYIYIYMYMYITWYKYNHVFFRVSIPSSWALNPGEIPGHPSRSGFPGAIWSGFGPWTRLGPERTLGVVLIQKGGWVDAYGKCSYPSKSPKHFFWLLHFSNLCV